MKHLTFDLYEDEHDLCIAIPPENADEDFKISINDERFPGEYLHQAGQAKVYQKYRPKSTSPMAYIVPIVDLQYLRKEGTD